MKAKIGDWITVRGLGNLPCDRRFLIIGADVGQSDYHVIVIEPIWGFLIKDRHVNCPDGKREYVGKMGWYIDQSRITGVFSSNTDENNILEPYLEQDCAGLNLL